jgi:predicted  nucleic acid-binding Zn-ribbon protein
LRVLKKFPFIAAAFTILLGTAVPAKAEYVETIPIYTGGDVFDEHNPTVLISNVYPGRDLVRPNKEIKSWPSNKTIWFGPRRYATVYHGHPDDGGRMNGNTTFPAETKDGVQNITAYQFAWIHLAGPFDKSEPTSARVIQNVKYVDDSLIKNLFNGNPDYVLDEQNVRQYYVVNKNTGQHYGYYYWIRDLASLSGGEADNDPGESLKGINETYLRVIKTDYPDITEFRLKPGSPTEVGKKLELEFEGYEYVSEGRNSYKWLIEVTGPKNGTISGSRTSTKGVTNPAKPYLKRYTGKFTSGSTYFTPQAPGTYTLKLTITDAVQRSVSKTITVTVNNPSNPPGGGSGGSGGSGGTCDAPSIIGGDLRYQYELDLEVKKIEGETVERNSTTTTPVEVHRKDFSASRERVRNEIQADKQRAENEKAQLEAQKAQLEAQKAQLENQLAATQSAKASCEATPPDEDGNKPDCSGYDSQISNLQNQIAAKQAEIEQKECEIATKAAEIAGFQKELDDLQALEDQWRVVNTNVLLTFNGIAKGDQPVSLQEGETKVLNFNWVLPSDGTVKAEINPNRDLGIDEITYSNNALSTPIYVATHATASCSPIGGISSISGVVRTITTESGTQKLYEYLTGQIVNQSRSSMRAGYGFSFEVKTTYRNEDPKSNAYGPSRTEAYFPTLVNYLPYLKVADGYQVNMDLLSNSASSPPRNETKTWGLPVVYVEEYSGNVFDKNYASNPKHNPNENILNGGRKWYVDFEQPDGPYDFKAKAFDAGVNKLNVCMNGSVEIKGSFIGDKNGNDDFVRRSVNPNNPFPGGVGWNWIGKESIITALKDWWDGPPTDPDNAPSGYYYKTFMVDVDLLRRIKEYNDKHGTDVKLDDQFRTEIGGF